MIGVFVNALLCFISIILMVKGQDTFQFSFVPSPNITILQSAVYWCAVNEYVPIQWTVNGINSATSSWPSYINSVGITEDDGAGDHNSTLTIPGNNTSLNGTTVVCKAFGRINRGMANEEILDKTVNATLYIQGKPSKVGVFCQYEPPFTINCTWNTSFILPGINGSLIYRVNITYIDQRTSTTITNGTTMLYTTNDFMDVYSISVAAVIVLANKELEGDIDSIVVGGVHFTSRVFLYHSDGNQLICNVSVMGLEYQPYLIALYIESVLDMISSNYTIDQLNDNGELQGWNGITDVTDMSRIRNAVAHIVIYRQFNDLPYFHSHSISTFDVIGLTVNPTNQTTQYNTAVRVCFMCVFNPLVSNPIGCNITYTSTSEGGAQHYSSGSLIITSTCSNSCIFLNITTYNITVYDIDYNNISYETEPAYRMDNISIQLNESSTLPPISTSDNTDVILIVVLFTFIMVVMIILAVMATCRKVYKKNSSQNNYRPRVSSNPLSMREYSTITPSNSDECDRIQIAQLHTAAANNGTTLLANEGDSTPITEQGIDNFQRLTYKDVVDKYTDQISCEWCKFGSALAIIPTKLEEISANHPDNEQGAFCDVILEWQLSESRPFTKKTLEMVLNKINQGHSTTESNL